MSGESFHIMVVDDDQRLRSLLSRYLIEQGFRVNEAESAADARAKLAILRPDAMVLDVMMPGESGLDLMAWLRQDHPDLPTLMLTARGAPEDRIAGFEAGVDDYLPKPFDPYELVLRLRSMLRRSAPPPVENNGPIKMDKLHFDIGRQELSGPDGVIYLTGSEAALMTALARTPNEVLTREAIADTLGMDESSERAVDVQITRLRRKIEADPREPRFIHTVRGRGYMLKAG